MLQSGVMVCVRQVLKDISTAVDGRCCSIENRPDGQSALIECQLLLNAVYKRCCLQT